ncbi:MAG: hypothetical protein ACRD3Z_01115 [Nitrososphaerales archaeon]
MSIIMDASAIVSAANVAILIGLLILYARTYSSSRAQFTLGLMFFASLLLIQNAIGIYSYVTMAPFFTEAILPYLLAINIAELAGLSVLLKVTL